LPWLYAVAAKVLANHRRRLARRGALAPDLATGDPAELIGGDRGLATAFATLSASDREAICLVAWEGLSIEDAARAAGCSTAAFHVRLSRARARLARALETPSTLETSWTF
jgi:RNA polymerase sigma-70 factor (ECF subfamily)